MFFFTITTTICRLFVDYSQYSSTIRRQFVDNSHYLSTIRRLFADYSHYSPTIRTIRDTILLLSIAKKREPFSKPKHPLQNEKRSTAPVHATPKKFALQANFCLLHVLKMTVEDLADNCERFLIFFRILL